MPDKRFDLIASGPADGCIHAPRRSERESHRSLVPVDEDGSTPIDVTGSARGHRSCSKAPPGHENCTARTQLVTHMPSLHPAESASFGAGASTGTICATNPSATDHEVVRSTVIELPNPILWLIRSPGSRSCVREHGRSLPV